jgi:hypothetical protein
LGGSDVLLTRISVRFVVIIVAISSLCVVMGLCDGVGSELLGIDVLEEVEILHGVIGFGMKLVETLQGLVVVILVIVATTCILNRIDFVIFLAGTVASVGVVVVTSPITVVLVVAVVIAPITTIVVVVPTTVVVVVITT